MLNAIGIPLLFDGNISERSDALLKSAYLFNVPAYIYDLSEISSYLANRSVHALSWNGNEYCESIIDLPKYTELYCSISSISTRYPKEVSVLRALTVITDDTGLYKLDFQRRLLLSELSQYAIPTILIHSYEELLSNISMFRISFLKPFSGRKAKGSMKIETKEGKVYYHTPEGMGELTSDAFYKYYSNAGYDTKSRLLLEPCLNIQNDEGRAVDFRCLVSLNGEGQWQNVMTYARIGGSGVASNFSHGGSLNFAEDVLETLIPGHGAEKLEEINRVALQVAEFVRKESPNPVSWLGLDICVDRPSNQIYVIEANSKPGTKLVGPWPLSLVRAQYFKYLLKQTEVEK